MNAVKRTISPLTESNKTATKKIKILDEEPCKPVKSTDENYDFLFDEEDFDFDGLNEIEQKATQNTTNLDLTQWQRCIVESVERDRRTYALILKVREEDNHDFLKKHSVIPVSTCYLQGPWSHTSVDINDILSVVAIWDETLQAYKVDKDNGFCVTNPDTLISGTTVVGSLFCRRKAVLQERFRGIDSNSKVMVTGSLVHELLQQVLQKGLNKLEDIRSTATALLQSQEAAYMLYGSRLTREEIDLEVQKFIPNITDFVHTYVQGREPTMIKKDDFQGTITDIQDIEENLWVPQFGLKGKIDVSVRIQRRRNVSGNKNAIPLELKTGRASFSMEHKGQLILYQMMLTAIGRTTQSGLLLYLREGIMREIHSARNEQRDLIVLRNELSRHLVHMPPPPPASFSLKHDDEKYYQPFNLPEPISHPTACGSCAYASICCTFAKTDAKLDLRDNHPLRTVMQQTTVHLTNEDYSYFIRWCLLLTLEDQASLKTNYMRSLWTNKPHQRQQQGRAVCGLQLSDGVIFEDSRFLHTFKLSNTDLENIDMNLSGFDLGEYVIVSTDKRIAIAAGCVYDLTKSSISISLERDLHKNYIMETFIIDKHESQSGNVFNFTNLGLLLDDKERSNALRKTIIKLEPPTYHKVLPKVVATDGAVILKELNSVQRAAVLKALTTQSFVLIKGLPGTGKTQTLVAIVRLLDLMGKTVIITSHTHSAVDNLLLRLKEYNLNMLRLGSGARINSQLKAFSEAELLKDCKTEADLSARYASFNIVGVTCLGAAHSIFLHRKFDYCIVDEATQVMQPTVLRPLFFCEKFILVGDPDQLPPLIRSREGRQRGADESLFQRLDSPDATAVLTLQYRMNKTITKLANELTYGGALQCASNEVQLASIKLNTVMFKPEKWLQRVLQSHIDQAVFLLDTLDCAERTQNFASNKHSATCAAIETRFGEQVLVGAESSPTKQAKNKRLSKFTNYCDAAIVFHIVKSLLAAGFDSDRIGIIAPYRAQVELLRKLAAQHQQFYASHEPALHFSDVEVNTVDQYQGRDKDIILYSCTKTGSVETRELERSRDAEILEDKRRLTVAITRSKHKLILIGDAQCLEQYTPFKSLLSRIPNYCKLKLEDDKLGFQWKTLMEEFNNVIVN